MNHGLENSNLLLVLGFIFLVGLAADLAGRHSRLPRVTLLLLCGIAVGPAGFGVLPQAFVDAWFPVLTQIALALIGFLLGQTLSLASLRRYGSMVMGVTLGETTGALVFVSLALMLIGIEPIVALLIGGIATATAPAAIYDIVHESGIKGPFSDTLLAVVAVDDAVALLWFTMMMALAGAMQGASGVSGFLFSGLSEIGGSLLVGLAVGLPMAALTGRVQKGEPTQAEAIGFVLLGAGVAIWLELSAILTCMTMGAVVASLAHHHRRPFHAIEGFEWPFMILFFLLAGASARLDMIAGLGAVVGVYIAARCVGSYLGCVLGAHWTRAGPMIRRYMGLALFPQAGVAIGMALLAAQRFPDQGRVVLPTVLASTVLLEVLSPPLTRWVLARASNAATEAE